MDVKQEKKVKAGGVSKGNALELRFSFCVFSESLESRKTKEKRLSVLKFKAAVVVDVVNEKVGLFT